MPQKEILDPQGKAVEMALNQLSSVKIENVRIGKKIDLTIDASSKEQAISEVELISKKLLANLIMEDFTFELIEIN